MIGGKAFSRNGLHAHFAIAVGHKTADGGIEPEGDAALLQNVFQGHSKRKAVCAFFAFGKDTAAQMIAHAMQRRLQRNTFCDRHGPLLATQ